MKKQLSIFAFFLILLGSSETLKAQARGAIAELDLVPWLQEN